MKNPSLFLLLIATMLMACGTTKSSTQKTEMIPFTQIYADAYGNADGQGHVLVSSADEWDEAWTSLYTLQDPPPPMPEVDFSKDQVLIYRLGSRPSGGYGAEVASLTIEGNTLLVHILEKQPGAGCITTMAITNPFVVISLPKKDYDTVTVDVKIEKTPCR
ncbi:MAG: protease complex subunit PrcB family protein [Bacteroidia bacterium]